MHVEDRFTVNVPQTTAWSFLSDPVNLARCLPGCREVQPKSPDVLDAEVEVELGPARLTFRAEVRTTERTAPARLAASASGRPLGLGGQLRMDMALALSAPQPQATEVHVSADVRLGGPLGAIGEPAFRAKATETMREMAARLRAAIESGQTEVASGAGL